MSEASPRPWTTSEGVVRDANGNFVATTWEDRDAGYGPSRDIADAFHIIEAVNAHEDDARQRVVELRGLLRRFFKAVPHERHDYSGVGWCAGCGAVLYVSGDGQPRDPCKPDCILDAVRKELEGAEK